MHAYSTNFAPRSPLLQWAARGAPPPRRTRGRALRVRAVRAGDRDRPGSRNMATTTAGLTASGSDIWLLDGVRTPFADYNGALAAVSPTDLGIKAAREVFAHAGVAPQDVGAVITGSMAQASFDTYCLPRHIGLYSDVPIEIPAHMVQRVCGTGIEALMQAPDYTSHKDMKRALGVGVKSMSRNPVASYTMRGFRMGAVDFKDFLWEALLDPAANVSMGDTAENLARQYQITRPQVDAFAVQSFERALAAQRAGFFAGEITPIRNERFERQDYQPRELKLRGTKELAADTHVRPSPLETLAGIRPALGVGAAGGDFCPLARRLLRLCQEARQARAGAHRGGRNRRRAAGDHGHRPGAGHQGGARARR